MGAREEGGAESEEGGRAGGDLPAPGQEEESGAGAAGGGETPECPPSVGGRAVTTSVRSQGDKHKQISDRLRDAQSKRRIQKAEVDLINQRRDTRIAEIHNLQLQFEVRARGAAARWEGAGP